MNLLLLDERELVGDTVELTDARATHVREVLGLEVGRRLRVGVIDGPVGAAVVEATSDARVCLRCTWDGEPPPRPPIDLLLAVPRPKVLKRLYAPLASLGIGRLYLTNAARVEKYYFDSHALDPALSRARLLEGLAQARDTRVPEVEVHRSFRALVEDRLEATRSGRLRLLADAAYARAPADAASGVGEGQRVLLAVGPEGGWVAFERALLERHGFVGVGLGPRTLRADVACVALLAVVADALRAVDQRRTP